MQEDEDDLVVGGTKGDKGKKAEDGSDSYVTLCVCECVRLLLTTD